MQRQFLLEETEATTKTRLQPRKSAVLLLRRRLLRWSYLLLPLLLILFLALIVWTKRWENVAGLPRIGGDDDGAQDSDAIAGSIPVLPQPAQVSRSAEPKHGMTRKEPAAKRVPAQREAKSEPRLPWWRSADKWLLLLESAAVLFVVIGGIAVWTTLQDLNDTYRNLHQADPRILPTVVSAANPLLSDIQLPPNEPDRPVPQLLPASGALAAPPLPTPHPTATPTARETPWAQEAAVVVAPTPVPDHAQRIQIPAIGVDSHVFQSNDPRALKLGVAQFGYLTAPGQSGNLVIAGHNDTYGEIFRYLGDLERGDEVTLFGSQRTYTYHVRDKIIVEPEDVWVMLPTSASTLTLITCHPYLIDSHRLVVFADFVE